MLEACFVLFFLKKTFVPFVKSRCVWAAKSQASSYLWTVTGIFGMHFSRRSKSPSSSLFSQSLSPSYTKEKRRNSWNFPFLFFIFLVKNPTGMMCVQCFFLTFRGGSSMMREEEKIRYWLHFLVCSCYSIGEFVSGERAKKENYDWLGVYCKFGSSAVGISDYDRRRREGGREGKEPGSLIRNLFSCYGYGSVHISFFSSKKN